MKKKVAILIMVDGAFVGEKYFEYLDQKADEWNINEEEPVDQAQWFFY